MQFERITAAEAQLLLSAGTTEELISSRTISSASDGEGRLRRVGGSEDSSAAVGAVAVDLSKAEVISKECWHLIGSFLGFADVCSLPLLSTHIKSHFDQNYFWQHYVLAHLFPPASGGAPVGMPLQLSLVEQPLSLFAKIWEHLNSGRVYNVAKRIVAVSSLDRAEESPDNVMTLSSCFYYLKSPNRNQQLLPYQQMLYEGYRIQRHCGCAGGRPCYWSSRPSTTQRSFEYLTVALSTSVACLTGFSITPYQAFFHPNAPVYGPLEVAIQIVTPKSERFISRGSAHGASGGKRLLATAAGGADWGNDDRRNRSSSTTDADDRATGSVSGSEATGDGHGSSSYREERLNHEETLRDVYFESEFFTVANAFEKQIFFLPEPVLCVGGEVRLIFRGMQTRQTLGFHLFPEDFYLCISNVGVLAVPFEGYYIRSDQQQHHYHAAAAQCGGEQLRDGADSSSSNSSSCPSSSAAASIPAQRVMRLALCRTQTMLLDMNAVRRDRQEDHGAVVCSPFVQKHLSSDGSDSESRNDSALYSLFRNSRLSSNDSDLQYSTANSCALC